MELGGVCLLNQFIANSPLLTVTRSKQALFDLNYSRAISGSSLIPAQAVPATDRMCVYNVRSQMMFTNLGSASAVMTLYVLVPVGTPMCYPSSVGTRS